MKKFAKDKNFKIYGYSNNHLPITYITALSYKRKHQIAIGPMFVKESARGKNLGIKEVFTKTWLANGSSRKIFSDLGFKEINRILHNRIGGDSTVYYKKVLNLAYKTTMPKPT